MLDLRQCTDRFHRNANLSGAHLLFGMPPSLGPMNANYSAQSPSVSTNCGYDGRHSIHIVIRRVQLLPELRRFEPGRQKVSGDHSNSPVREPADLFAGGADQMKAIGSRLLHWDTMSVSLTLGMRAGQRILRELGTSRADGKSAHVEGGHFFAREWKASPGAARFTGP